MSSPLNPSPSLLAKLGSIAVHVDDPEEEDLNPEPDMIDIYTRNQLSVLGQMRYESSDALVLLAATFALNAVEPNTEGMILCDLPGPWFVASSVRPKTNTFRPNEGCSLVSFRFGEIAVWNGSSLQFKTGQFDRKRSEPFDIKGFVETVEQFLREKIERVESGKEGEIVYNHDEEE